jgi:hypothetical protein
MPVSGLAMWSWLLLANFLIHTANSFMINIDAEEEHCFFERLKHGTTFTVMFEVRTLILMGKF